MPEAIRLQPPAQASIPASIPASISRAGDDSARLGEAACQFEALLIGQMLKSTREGDAGWLGTGEEDDQAGTTATELAEEQFAQAMARQGGLGLARLVVSGIEAQVNRTSRATAVPAPAHTPAGSAE
jgi:Rod binding domain-containing protein